MGAKTESGVLAATDDKYGGVMVDLVEAAAKQGFWYRHAEPNYVMIAYVWDTQVCSIILFLKMPHTDWELVHFLSIKIHRQSHESFFEKSDLLRPLSFDIQKQEQEIEAAKWMPFEEYAAQPFVQKYEFLKYLHDICKAKIDGNYTGFSPIPTTSF